MRFTLGSLVLFGSLSACSSAGGEVSPSGAEVGSDDVATDASAADLSEVAMDGTADVNLDTPDGSDVNDVADAPDAASAVLPILPGDFTTPVDKKFLRATDPDLSDSIFDAKWATVTGPETLVRSFPGAYYQDLLQVPPAKVIGLEGICMGDAHYENFGWLQVAGKTVFAFNDFDDSGYGMFSLDVARYMAMIRLVYADETLTNKLLDHYVATLADPSRAIAIDATLAPIWADVAAKEIKKVTTSTKLLFDYASEPDLSSASAADRKAIQAALAKDVRFTGATYLDIAFLDRSSGGSGGLRRYWLFVEQAGVRTIYELKEVTTPGVELGKHTKVLASSERLDVLQSTFWGSKSTNDYFYLYVVDGRFLVRSRLTKKSISLSGLTTSARDGVLLAQTSLIAKAQVGGFPGIATAALRNWVDVSSKTLADRWAATFAATR